MSNIKKILRRSHSLKCFLLLKKINLKKKNLLHNIRNNRINLMKMKENRKQY